MMELNYILQGEGLAKLVSERPPGSETIRGHDPYCIQDSDTEGPPSGARDYSP